MANAIPHEAASPGATPRTVDELLALDVQTLERLYRDAKTPAIEDLHGNLIGRMLPSPMVNAPVAEAMRALARFRLFPWKGKTFAPRDAQRGEGWNRVLSDKNLWFRFTTFIGPSRAGAFDALQLDYDHPENPFFIRAIKDEVRTVAPGLWLGQAWLVTPRGKWLVLYFALQRP